MSSTIQRTGEVKTKGRVLDSQVRTYSSKNVVAGVVPQQGIVTSSSSTLTKQHQNMTTKMDDFTAVSEMVVLVNAEFKKREYELDELLQQIQSKEQELAYSEVQTRAQAEELSTISSSYLFRKNTLECLDSEVKDFNKNDLPELTERWRQFCDSLIDAQDMARSFDQDSQYIQQLKETQKKDLDDITDQVNRLKVQQSRASEYLVELTSTFTSTKTDAETTLLKKGKAEEELMEIEAKVAALHAELEDAERAHAARAKEGEIAAAEREDAARRLTQSRADAVADREAQTQELQPLFSHLNDLELARAKTTEEAATLSERVANAEIKRQLISRELEALQRDTRTAKAKNDILQSEINVEVEVGSRKETERQRLRVELEHVLANLEVKRAEAAELERRFEDSFKSLTENMDKLRDFNKSDARQQQELKQLQEKLCSRVAEVITSAENDERQISELERRLSKTRPSNAEAVATLASLETEARAREENHQAAVAEVQKLGEECVPTVEKDLLRLIELKKQREATAALKSAKLEAVEAAKESLQQWRGEHDKITAQIRNLQLRTASLEENIQTPMNESGPSQSAFQSIPAECDDPDSLLAKIEGAVAIKREEIVSAASAQYNIEAAPILANLQQIAERGPIAQMTKDHARRVKELKAKLAEVQQRAAAKKKENDRMQWQIEQLEKQQAEERERATAATVLLARSQYAEEEGSQLGNDEDTFDALITDALATFNAPASSINDRSDAYEQNEDDDGMSGYDVNKMSQRSLSPELREEANMTQLQQWKRRYGLANRSVQQLFLGSGDGKENVHAVEAAQTVECATSYPPKTATPVPATVRKLTYSMPASDDESDISAFIDDSLFNEHLGGFGAHQSKRTKTTHSGDDDEVQVQHASSSQAAYLRPVSVSTRQASEPVSVRPTANVTVTNTRILKHTASYKTPGVVRQKTISTYGHRGSGDPDSQNHGQQGLRPPAVSSMGGAAAHTTTNPTATRRATPYPAASVGTRTYGGKIPSQSRAPTSHRVVSISRAQSSGGGGSAIPHSLSQEKMRTAERTAAPPASMTSQQHNTKDPIVTLPKPTKRLTYSSGGGAKAATASTNSKATLYAQTLSDWFFDEDVNL